MREIEIKFRVDNFENLIKSLEDKGCSIGEEVIQKDTIYVFDLDNVESVEGSVWLRVRDTNGVIELNYKRQSSSKIESREIEFKVSSYEKANSFLKELGYNEWVRVNKVRRYSKYKDFNICIDSVERLGDFVELEILVEDNNDIDYEKLIIDTANELGIDINNRFDGYYDEMIYNLDK